MKSIKVHYCKVTTGLIYCVNIICLVFMFKLCCLDPSALHTALQQSVVFATQINVNLEIKSIRSVLMGLWFVDYKEIFQKSTINNKICNNFTLIIQ